MSLAQRVCPLERLAGADLAIGGLDRGEHCARNRDRIFEGWEVHPSKPVHAHFGKQERVVGLGSVVATRRQDRRVLDGCGDHPRAATAAGIPQSLQTGTQRCRASRQERDLGGAYAESVGEQLARLIQQGPRPARLGVETLRVGPTGVQGSHQGGSGGGQHRCAPGVEQRATRGGPQLGLRLVRHALNLVPSWEVERPPL